MAQKDGRQSVWLNFGVSTRVHSITIEYDPEAGSIQSLENLATHFTRGLFDSSQSNSFAGQFFSSTKDPMSFSDLPDVEISGFTVTFNFPDNIRETKALRISEEGSIARDYVSLKASFTDYEPSASVRPKMSQPGKSLR